MRKINIGKSLFGLIICLLCLFVIPFHVRAEENVEFKLSGANKNIKIYSFDGKEVIPTNSENHQFMVVPGTYKYESNNGAEGFFYVTKTTSEVKLSRVNFKTVSPRTQIGSEFLYLEDLGRLHIYDETKTYEYVHEKDDIYTYLIPQQDGDSYYNFYI